MFLLLLVTKLCPTLLTPWTVGHRSSLYMEIPWQGYWNGLPFPSPWDLLDPGTELVSPALQADFPLNHLGSPDSVLVALNFTYNWEETLNF